MRRRMNDHAPVSLSRALRALHRQEGINPVSAIRKILKIQKEEIRSATCACRLMILRHSTGIVNLATTMESKGNDDVEPTKESGNTTTERYDTSKKVAFQEQEEQATASSSSNDFVIRNGFPALLKGDGSGKPLIEGIEPLPRAKFASYQQALFIPDVHRDILLQDCEKVFTARTKEDGAAYSAGCTYFVPCQMKPRCALEALALQIFKAHVADLEAKDSSSSRMYDPERSGAEWWTLVMDATAAEQDKEGDEKKGEDGDDDDEDDDDEVGMHFDADYGLEAQVRHMLLHPRVATVTYLSDHGAPTVIFDQPSPPPDDIEKKSLAGNTRKGWLSGPKLGKHMSFDGRLLHGAPTAFFPGAGPTSTKASSSNGDEPQLKRQKLTAETSDLTPSSISLSDKRVTFLVNVWLNHCPIDAELLDNEVCEDLKTPWEQQESTNHNYGSQEGGKNIGQLKGDESYIPPFEWKIDDMKKVDDTKSIVLEASKEDPAGSEETVICDREVTINFNATLDDLHKAAQHTAEGASVALDMGQGALNIDVGEEVETDDEAED